MKSMVQSWQLWALLSAAFAALTAVFAKLGVGQINSDFATLIRTFVVLVTLSVIVWGTGQWQELSSVPGRTY